MHSLARAAASAWCGMVSDVFSCTMGCVFEKYNVLTASVADGGVEVFY